MKPELKFLVDESVEYSVTEFLREKNFNVVSIAESFKSIEDYKIIRMAFQDDRILLTNDKDFGNTNTRGKVTVQSNTVRRPPKGTTFTFCVDNVVKTGWIYDSGANKETCDSVTV